MSPFLARLVGLATPRASFLLAALIAAGGLVLVTSQGRAKETLRRMDQRMLSARPPATRPRHAFASGSVRVPPEMLRQVRAWAELVGDSPDVITRDGRLRSISPYAQSIELGPGEVLRSRGPCTISREGEMLRILAPVRYVIGDASARAVALAPVVVVERGALVMADTGDRFASGVAVGLQDVSETGGSCDLSPGIRIRLIAGSAFVNPDIHTVTHAGAPFARSTLWDPAPPDTVQLLLATSFDPDELALAIPVDRPSVRLSARESLPGWGVGSTLVKVSLEGYPSTRPRLVTLKATQGELSKSKVVVSANRAEEVRFVSSGLGPASIQAENPGLRCATYTITQKPPIGFLASALLGSGAGAWIKNPLSRKRALKVTRARRIASLVVGVVLAVAWALDVSLLPVGVPFDYSELSVALAGALGAAAARFVLNRPDVEEGLEASGAGASA